MSDVLYGDEFAEGIDQEHADDLLYDLCSSFAQLSLLLQSPLDNTITPA